jgi:hypothetical protein
MISTDAFYDGSCKSTEGAVFSIHSIAKKKRSRKLELLRNMKSTWHQPTWPSSRLKFGLLYYYLYYYL